MASGSDEDHGKNEDGAPPRSDKQPQARGSAQNPAWASGLKQLYDSVVDEPLPDSFSDLLARFDEDEDAGDTPDGGDARA